MIFRSERSSAALATVLLHLLLLALTLMISLPEAEKSERDLLLTIDFAARHAKADERMLPTPTRSLPSPSMEQRPIVTDPPSTRQPQAVVDMPLVDTLRRRPTLQLPRNVLERDITPEQAWDELTRLLEQYPEYREMVVREMIAGAGFVPDSLPPVSFHLEDVMKFETFLPGWMYEMGRMQGMHGGYSPVMGHRRTEQYTGPQFNVLQGLKFLLDLIGGRE
jgi:hypothetical protein